jgi:hypothetical protein
MTLFEYLAIAFSLVFSFAAMRLVAGLPYAVQRHSRYWVHAIAVCGQLLATIGVFWVFWSYRAVAWSLPRFLLVLGSPGMIYFNACTIMPENPSSVSSWREYYYSVHRRYFLGILCWALVITAASTFVLQLPWSHPSRLLQVVVVASGVVGAVSASERVHGALAIGLTTFFCVFAGVVAFQPGPLSR